jgi:hypothetical protein
MPLGGICYQWVAFPMTSVVLGTDPAGQSLVSLRVPNVPSMSSYPFYFQYAVLDPAGMALGTASVTAGLQVIIGS